MSQLLGMNAAIRALAFVAIVAVAWIGAGSAWADAVEAQSAALLSARYEALRGELSQNPYRRPIYIESSEISGGVSGDVFAIVDYPFSTTEGALNGTGTMV